MSQLHARARDLLDGVSADQAGARAIGRLASYDGLMLEATGFTRPIGAGARIVSDDNQVSRAEVVGFRGNRTLLMALDGAAAQLVGKDVEPTRLRAHPDDIIYLEAGKLAVPLHPDPTLTRGAIVLETGHGWIEDGPAVRLDRLRAALDKMVAPR